MSSEAEEKLVEVVAALLDCCGGCRRGERLVSGGSIHEGEMGRSLCSLTERQRAALAKAGLRGSVESEDLRDKLYGWTSCDHQGIGKPGCETCDPVKGRCVSRAYIRTARMVEEYAALKRDSGGLSIESLVRLAAAIREHAR